MNSHPTRHESQPYDLKKSGPHRSRARHPHPDRREIVSARPLPDVQLLQAKIYSEKKEIKLSREWRHCSSPAKSAFRASPLIGKGIATKRTYI